MAVRTGSTMNDLRNEIMKDLGLEISREISSVGVLYRGKLLMGKRRDSGRWTLPGGHLEEGESPYEAAVRELEEESGIEASNISAMGSVEVVKDDGERIKVHAFVTKVDDDFWETDEDPDQEVKKWKWVDLSDGLPKKIRENLNNQNDDVVLKLMGLI